MATKPDEKVDQTPFCAAYKRSIMILNLQSIKDSISSVKLCIKIVSTSLKHNFKFFTSL